MMGWSQKELIMVVVVGLVIGSGVTVGGWVWMNDSAERLDEQRDVVIVGDESIPEQVVFNQSVKRNGVVKEGSVVQYTNVSSGEYAVTSRESEYRVGDGSSEFVRVREMHGTFGWSLYERTYVVDSSGSAVAGVPQYSETIGGTPDGAGKFVEHHSIWSMYFEGLLEGVPGERVGEVSYQGESAIRYELGRDGVYWGETQVASVDGWLVTDSSTNQLYAADVTIEIVNGNKLERVTGLGDTRTISYTFSSTVDVEGLDTKTGAGE